MGSSASDADEFIEPINGLTLAEALSGQEPTLFRIGWNNFSWNPALEDSAEQNPVVRQRLRLPALPYQANVLVHAKFVNENVELALGSHFLIDSGRQSPMTAFDRVQICHYPVRSVTQYIKKIVIGYLQYSATPDWDQQPGWQYVLPFRELANNGLFDFEKRAIRDSLYYGVPEAERSKEDPIAAEAPLRYLGGALTLTPPQGPFLPDVLRHAEFLASEFAANTKRSAR